MTEDEYKKQLMSDYQFVFDGDAGERVLKDICRLSGLFDEPATDDPYAIMRIMGAQTLAKQICALHGRGMDILMQSLIEGQEHDRHNGNGGDNRDTGDTSGNIATDNWT